MTRDLNNQIDSSSIRRPRFVLRLTRNGQTTETAELAYVRAEGQFLVLFHTNGDQEFIPADGTDLALVYRDDEESDN